jgi:hypothetical protein
MVTEQAFATHGQAMMQDKLGSLGNLSLSQQIFTHHLYLFGTKTLSTF